MAEDYTDIINQMIGDGWSQSDAQNYLDQADIINQMIGDGWSQGDAQNYLDQADIIEQMMGGGWTQADAQKYLDGTYTGTTGGTSGSSSGGTAAAGGSMLNKLLGLFQNADGTGYDWSKVGLGGLAAGGVLGALMDNDPVTKASTDTQTTTLPAWYTDAAKSALASAQNLPTYQKFFGDAGSGAAPLSADEKRAAELYRAGPTGYTGNLTQGLDPRFAQAVETARGALTGYSGNLTQEANANTQDAADLARGSVGGYAPLLAGATGAAVKGGGSILDMGLEKYMNPYWDLALNPQEKKIRQDQALAQNDLNARLAKTGSFGGSRTAVAQALNTQEGNRRVDDMYATGAKNAFDAATGLATGDRSAQQQLSGALSGLATTGSNLVGSDISRLSSTGADLNAIDLGNLLRPYGEFTRQQAAAPGAAQMEFNVGQAGQSNTLENLLRPYQEFTRQQAAVPSYISGLQGIGAAERGVADTDITRRWQDYLNSIQSPVTNQAALTSTLYGAKAPGTVEQVHTESASPESPWKALLGTGSTLWSLANPKGV